MMYLCPTPVQGTDESSWKRKNIDVQEKRGQVFINVGVGFMDQTDKSNLSQAGISRIIFSGSGSKFSLFIFKYCHLNLRDTHKLNLIGT